jgi:hypothetical protein
MGLAFPATRNIPKVFPFTKFVSVGQSGSADEASANLPIISKVTHGLNSFPK